MSWIHIKWKCDFINRFIIHCLHYFVGIIDRSLSMHVVTEDI